ncbi:helix-turn-helix domain-containing protein [Streptomyces sp. NPDC059679]|uniref:helix-turn-helix domain-containing protein n=1 Tax=Streptomyces sp. NPDC059679 TaxID=3346903 RepID=UPI00367D07C9
MTVHSGSSADADPRGHARSKGKLKGKQPKLTARQQAHFVKEHHSGEHTIADIAELFSVSRATVYRVMECAETVG